MSERTYQVRDVARLTGVTVRTLHHYDHVGLLEPSFRTGAGYRVYTREDLLRLQEILVGRELGLSLAEIRGLLDAPDHDRERTLREHRERLIERGRRNAALVRAVDAALAAPKGDGEMDETAIFDGFDPSIYEEEARDRWGETEAYRESARRTKSYSAEDRRRIHAENEELLDAMAECLGRGAEPDDPMVLGLAEGLRLHIDRWYYPCSPARHAALADLYVGDPRFAEGYERRRAGLAEFVAGAVRANAARG